MARLYFSLPLLCITWCACLPTLVAEPDTKGLVAEEPAEGPFVKTDRGFMVPYTDRLPSTDVTFEMIPVPGGEFLLGSPDDEEGRNDDEGPQVRVRVEPFWIGKCEVTWAEYQTYMELYPAFKKLEELSYTSTRMEDVKERLESLPKVKNYLAEQSLEVDAVTCPTPLYDPEMTYEAGDGPQQPAVTMSQFGAKQYTKWLSGITGRDYRLPTEAEWEYAARAGTTTAYSFGNDPDELEEYAWFADNADDQLQDVATKKPNDWGLYDMHGNVAEWVLDEYREDHFAQLTDGVSAWDAVAWPTKLYPRTIRGGSWLSDASECRSAARQESDDSDWTMSDPNLPTSPWWFTEEPARGIGMRLVRPLQPMDEEMKRKVWEPDIERIELDVADRLEEGRGTRTSADPRLPDAVKEVRASGLLDE